MRLNGKSAPTKGYAAACGQSFPAIATLVEAVVVASRSGGVLLAACGELVESVEEIRTSDVLKSVVEATLICASASMRRL